MSTIENNRDLFTAHAIAAALNISRQHVFKALKTVPPSGQVLKAGRPVSAWAFLSLPADFRARLDSEADRLGFRNAEQMLESGRTLWQPDIPLNEVAENHIQKAADLRKALLPVLEQLSDLKALASVEDQGLRLYQEIMGHRISSRHWRRLIMRTFNRDRGNDNFQRLELYLDDKLSRRPSAPTKASNRAQDGFEGIRSAIAAVKNLARPAATEKDLIWCHTMTAIEQLQMDGMTEKQAIKAVLEFLNSEALFIAKNQDALRAALYRKLNAFKKCGGHFAAIKDKRAERSGNRRAPVLSENDRLTILAYAAQAGARLSQGWREARRDQALSPALMQHYSFDERRNKSYVPSTIRTALTHEVRMVDDHHHGPHCAKMNGAFLERDPNAIHSGDWFQGDDTTLPIYFHNERDPRKPTRGQFLIMCDIRSEFILSFVLIADKSYNGRDVRNLITTTCDRWGLPRKGFYFEKGSWKSNAVTNGISWAETEHGITTGLNRRFVHAREARAKIVERIFAAFQNYTERVQGYVGRDERHDCYEKMQKQLQAVRSGKIPGVEALLTQQELCAVIETIIDQYNNDPQGGKYCLGMTPEEAYLKNFGDVPLVKLGRTTRYLLADTVEKVKVGRNGISLIRGKDRFIYKSEETGRLQGKEVLAWFSPENPDILGVTDLKKQNPFTVERAQAVPLMDADPDLLAQELARNETHNGYGKRLYKAVKQRFPDELRDRMFAPTIMDEETATLGLELEYQRQQADKQRKKTTKQREKIATGGFKPSPIAERQVAQAEAVPRLQDFINSLRPAGTPTL
jgi:hypothetical protein